LYLIPVKQLFIINLQTTNNYYDSFISIQLSNNMCFICFKKPHSSAAREK